MILPAIDIPGSGSMTEELKVRSILKQIVTRRGIQNPVIPKGVLTVLPEEMELLR